jgi:riboflavin synthase alpha subunit
MARVADLCSVSLAGDFMNGDIVVTVDGVEFGSEVITLHSEAISVELKIADAPGIHVVVLVQVGELVIDGVKLAVNVHSITIEVLILD